MYVGTPKIPLKLMLIDWPASRLSCHGIGLLNQSGSGRLKYELQRLEIEEARSQQDGLFATSQSQRNTMVLIGEKSLTELGAFSSINSDTRVKALVFSRSVRQFVR